MASTLLEFLRQLAIGAAADSARKTETGQELQGAVDKVFGVDDQTQRVRADSEEGQRRLAEMSRQLEARKEAAMYGDPAMVTPEPPTQRKFGAPGTTFREGTPDSERGLNALLDTIRQQGINQDMAGFAASQGADDPSLDFTEPPASAYAPVEKVDPNTVTPIIRSPLEQNDPEYQRYKESLRSQPLEKVNPADVKAINRDPERQRYLQSLTSEQMIDPDAPGEDMNSQIDQSVLLPVEEKVAVVKQQVQRMPAEVIEKGKPMERGFWESLDLTEAERQGLSANDISAMYQAYLATKKLPEQVQAAGDDEGFLGKLGSSLGNFFGNERNMLIMASAFNTLRFQPDAQFEKGIQDRLTQIGTTTSNNQTAQFLLKKGYPDLAQMLIGNPNVKASDVLALYKEEAKKGTWRPATAEERAAYNIPSFMPVRVNTATNEMKGIGNLTPPNFGPLPKGTVLTTNEQGWTLEQVPMKPSPEAGRSKAKGTERDVATVEREIGYALDLIENSPTATGSLGSLIRSIPIIRSGTDPQALKTAITGIQSKIGFDRLQRMRDESTTGGALGQVAVQELIYLQADLGALDLDDKPENLKKRLYDIYDIYQDRMREIQYRFSADELVAFGMDELATLDENGVAVKIPYNPPSVKEVQESLNIRPEKNRKRFSAKEIEKDVRPVGK